MAIESMTGFARVESIAPSGLKLVCEIRSVNGKSLDLRLRLPPALDRLELPLKQIVQKHITRGNLQISVSSHEAASVAKLEVNHLLIEQLLALSERLEQRHGLVKPSIGELLSIRGVMENAGSEPDLDLDRPISALVEATLITLKQSRRLEGAALVKLMLDQLDRMENLVATAVADPSRSPQFIRLRLAAQIKVLMESVQGFDEQRLTMEAALMATKADIREELDRLVGHIAAARTILSDEGPVGRKLDFLSQEFNRETNTLCSKSNALSITNIGLELKLVVDQFREQVQNLE